VKVSGAQLEALFVRRLLMCRELSSLIPFAAVREESALFAPPPYEGAPLGPPSTQRHGVRVVNRATMDVWRRDAATKRMTLTRYVGHTSGRIDLERRDRDDPNVFGWDDIFVPDGTSLSFHELAQRGLKVSARQTDLASFLVDFVHYREGRDLRWNPQNPRRCVDFDIDPAVMLLGSPFLRAPEVQKRGCSVVVRKALNTGLYFRFPFNRRHVNYFMTAVSGLPATPKRDALHEHVFQTHDLGHIAIQELIFTGNDSFLHRTAFVAYRMLSEAMTMVYADMFTVDALVCSQENGEEGFPKEYDWSKRRIYPLFKATGLRLDDPETRDANLLTLMQANANCLMKGDDSMYRNLIIKNNGDLRALDEFKEKYGPFFVEDFRWSARNYDLLCEAADPVRRWWESTERLRGLTSIKFESIDDFLRDLPLPDGVRDLEDCTESQLIDACLKFIYERQLNTLFQDPVNQQASGGDIPIAPRWLRMERAFVRYMMGQLSLFAHYDFVAHANRERDRAEALTIELVEQSVRWAELDQDDHAIGAEEEEARWRFVREKIAATRAVVESFLVDLVHLHLITEDDRLTYAEQFPLFSVFYVSYDQDRQYESLDQVFEREFSRSRRLRSMCALYERGAHCKLATNAQRTFLLRKYLLVEACGGTVDNGVFVMRPGVLLLGKTVSRDVSLGGAGVNNPAAVNVSFLLAGCSVETSLEMIAHGEAKVARLTTSRTSAMEHPLYRVLDTQDPENQKLYFGHMLRRRSHLRKLLRSDMALVAGQPPTKTRRDRGEFEVDNQAASAAKTTFLVYTMSLADYNKLFIGRCAPGNEQETVDICCDMADQLHARYPDYIRTSAQYRQAHNSEKLNSGPLSADAPSVGPLPDGANVLADFCLTDRAIRLFKAMGMNTDPTRTHVDMVAEFCARITYLSFPRSLDYDPSEFIRKTIIGTGHYSVLGCARINVALPCADQEAQRWFATQVVQRSGVFTPLASAAAASSPSCSSVASSQAASAVMPSSSSSSSSSLFYCSLNVKSYVGLIEAALACPLSEVRSAGSTLRSLLEVETGKYVDAVLP